MSLNTVQNGKGDKSRVTDRQAFDSNWDRIRWRSGSKSGRQDSGSKAPAERGSAEKAPDKR